MSRAFVILPVLFSCALSLPSNSASASDYLHLAAGAMANPQTNISLSWDGHGSGKTMKIKWKQSSSSSWGPIQTQSDCDEARCSYIVGNLSCSTKYDFAVKMEGRWWKTASAWTAPCRTGFNVMPNWTSNATGKPGASSLVVQKVVTGPFNLVPKGTSFAISAACKPTPTGATTNYPLSVAANQNFPVASVLNLPLGTQCHISETLPAPPPNCTWQAPVYSPQDVKLTAPGGWSTVTVTNAYTC